MPRTIGLDFGTHQTKICVEEKDRFETRYSFVSFTDDKGGKSYVLPSIIRVNADGRLSYGYVERGIRGKIVRYFKQATFTNNPSIWKNRVDAEYYTIWYLAYILFILEDKYNGDYSINFGIPTDNDRYEYLKKKAVSLLLSAYRLVEDVYRNDMEAFLNESITSLMEKSVIQPYSEAKKDFYNILVFPEAYACLRPLAVRGKIETGMNLMIDIGGGTTDISFFTMEKEKKTDKLEKPQIYELLSIPMGLNYLTKAEENLDSGKLDSIVDVNTALDWYRQAKYFEEISKCCEQLRKRILSLFRNSTQLNEERVKVGLKNRLVYFTGGGSAFSSLRRAYGDFSDVKHITARDWGTYSFEEMDEISKLCPILSTVFGLSISAATDTYKKKPLSDLFIHLKDLEEEPEPEARSNSYKDNWMNKEYGVLNIRGNNTSSRKKAHGRSVSTPPKHLSIFPTPQKTKEQKTNINPVAKATQAPNPTFSKDRLPVIQRVEFAINNLSFHNIERKGLATHKVKFTICDGSKVVFKCFGKIILKNGIPYDIYTDRKRNLIIDSLDFVKDKFIRNTIIAVQPGSPLHIALETYGIESIDMIERKNKKRKKKTYKATSVIIKKYNRVTNIETIETYISKDYML